MTKVIEVDYTIGDKAILIEINRPCQIISVTKDSEGISYRACYWDGGSRKTDYVFSWELKPNEQPVPNNHITGLAAGVRQSPQ